MKLIEVFKALLLGAGAAWVLWLLIGLATCSVAIAVERALYFRGRGGGLAVLARSLERHLAAGDLEGARRALEGARAVAASVAQAGLRLAHLGPAAAEKAMQGALALERERLEARLAFLGTLGNNAPFVGLFGTVIGVVQAFDQLGVAGAGATAVAGQAAPQAVMAGIAEALIATAVGIGVALPAVAAYNAFQRRISGLLAGTEALSNVVLTYLLAEVAGPPVLTAGGTGSRPIESVIVAARD
jgi:biopolymer transport protein ExbB